MQTLIETRPPFSHAGATPVLFSPLLRSRAINLLQIAGTFAVVGTHVGAPYSQSGWVVVEMFFVIAGLNMTAALHQSESLLKYGAARALRLGPELAIVWFVAVFFAVFHAITPGMSGFLISTPFFLQNLSLPFFTYNFPRDWLFVPLWFVGALFQLQLVLFALKRWLLRTRPTVLMLVFILCGVSFRVLFSRIGGAWSSEVSPELGNALYCMPFSHIEAIGLGFIVGRGMIPRLGQLLPWLALVTLALGLLNVAFSAGAITPRSLGYELPLRTNSAHIWGYTVLALTMAALCSPNSAFNRFVQQMRLTPRVDHILNRLASLTYGVYVFHGVIIATGINGQFWLAQPHAPVLRLILLFITLAEAYFFAWLCQKSRREWRKTRQTSLNPETSIQISLQNEQRNGLQSLSGKSF